ncbi:unnamed protein product [Blepharisma stoltei]|uniref:Uncharacterized protein n=1 Tax=Blepharisma stoltei TaxID=1481888 RepID=A0AAU9JUJ1_9CILI|nr:unnamed protein product [Blepharisma stoltei]
MKHASLILLFIASLAWTMETSSCSKLVCGSAGSSTSGACVTVTDKTVTLNPCPSASSCGGNSQFYGAANHTSADCSPDSSPSSSETTCPDSSKAGTLNTYEYCCQNSDCYSKNCDSSKHCVGVPSRQTCSSDSQCEPNYFCSSSECIKCYSEGDSCTGDVQCKLGYGCNYNECTRYWSLDNGSSTQSAVFCKSNFMYKNYCDSADIYVQSDKLSDPWKCTVGDTCTYKYNFNGATIGTQSCLCDGKGSTTGYCPISNSFNLKGFDDKFYPRFAYTNGDCAGSYGRKTDLANDLSRLVYCNSIDQDGYNYYSSMVSIKKAWPLYSSGEIDKCALDMKIFDPSYSMGSWSSGEMLLISSLFMIFN